MKKIFVSLVLIFAVGSLFAKNNSTIVLDAAHGGKDTGTQSKITINTKKVKLYEKDITLAICKRVQALLNDKEAGLNLVLTRNSDTFISLKNAMPCSMKMLFVFPSIVKPARIKTSAGLVF